MPRNVTNPRTRQFNERQIQRDITRFDQGAIKDIDSIDLPPGAVAELKNAHGFRNHIQGRAGSELFHPADISVLLGGSESITTSFQSGEIYTANGSAVPDVGDLIMVNSEDDFTGVDLSVAKGSNPRKYDLFEVTNNSSGLEGISFIGNIRIPPLPGFGDTTGTEFNASKSGTTITATSGTFTSAVEGNYFVWDDGDNDYITSFTSSTVVEVSNSGTKSSQSRCHIRPPINASFYHKSSKKWIMLFGERIYYSSNIPAKSWTEIGGNFTNRPKSHPCKFYEDEDDVILINGNGVFRIKISENVPYFWKINEKNPQVQITEISETSVINKKYRYLYSLLRLNTSNYNLNRTGTGVLLEQETGSNKPDSDGKDYSELFSQFNVGPSGVLEGFVLGTILTNPYDSANGFKDITDGQVKIIVNSITKNIGVDLSDVETLDDVAEKLQTAIRISPEFSHVKIKVKDTTNGNVFVLIADNAGDTVGFPASGTGGTDLLSLLGWSGASISNSIAHTSPVKLAGLTYPNTARSFTHYGFYRTEKLEDDGEDTGNLLNQYIWTNDVPIMKPLNISVTGTTMTVTTGSLDNDIDDSDKIKVRGVSGTYSIIATSSTLGTIVGFPGPDGNYEAVLGSVTPFSVTQSGTTITVTGISLTASDEGKLIFFADGTYDTIINVTASSTATVIKSTTKSAQAASINPTSRTVNDNITDETLESRQVSFPLISRAWTPLPTANIGIVIPGFIITAIQGKNKYYYSQIVESQRYLSGHHLASNQFNDKIKDSIQEFLHEKDMVIIRCRASHHRINSAVTTSIINSDTLIQYILLSDPEVIDSYVGCNGEGAIATLEDGGYIGYTNEPAIRGFNSFNYGPNLASDRIQNSDIQKLKPAVIVAYDHNLGAIFWGQGEM